MTALRILLVTGSRALADSEYESDAVNIVRALVFALPSLALVVAGDAIGPDAWAIDAATSSARALARNIGASVRVLALEAAWSETKGTAHTARLAEEAGFEVTRVTFARGATR